VYYKKSFQILTKKAKIFKKIFLKPLMDIKTEEKHFWFFGPPPQRKQGPKGKITLKMTNFRPKNVKI